MQYRASIQNDPAAPVYARTRMKDDQVVSRFESNIVCIASRPRAAWCKRIMNPPRSEITQSPERYPGALCANAGRENRKVPRRGLFGNISVRPGRIELPTYPWQGYVIPLNHGRNVFRIVSPYLILFAEVGQIKISNQIPHSARWILNIFNDICGVKFLNSLRSLRI